MIRALLHENLLPRIIAGSSVGSIVAAIAAVHADEELKHLYSNMANFNLDFFGNSTPLEYVRTWIQSGHLQVRPTA